MFVKICGITSEEDALLAVAMGADAVGFVFAPSSRQVAPGRAADIAKRLPPEILTVGVFRDDAPERVVEVVSSTGLRAAQLHGHETIDQTRWVKARVPVVIKAFPGGDPDLARAAAFGADAVLVDSASPGSGRVFDWSLAEGAPSGLRLILAGGLTPANVADAVDRVRPWGVDVSSGVEAEPGRKDARKVRQFVNAARAAAPAAYAGGEERPFDWMVEG
ncbi:MAG: phosphoribosylanthranilate isomerase [Acidimicrobiia bacterium]